MSRRGISAGGVYLPTARLSADAIADAWGRSTATGIAEKTVAAADEDALTMAIEAGERALSATAVDRSEIGLVAVATTTPPLAEGDLASRLVRALGLPKTVETATSSQHTAAGAEALSRAVDADVPALVVASDCPKGDPADSDHPLGAGAAAFVVEDDPVISLSAMGWCADESPGIRFREADGCAVDSLGITTYDRSAIAEAVGGAIDDLTDSLTADVSLDNDGDTNLAAVERAAIHQPNGKLPYRLTRSLPVETAAVAEGTVVDRVGDAGATTVLVGLLSALSVAESGERTLAAFFGGGTAAAVVCTGGFAKSERGDVLGLEGFDAGESIDYETYLRRRGYLGSADVGGGGANVSLPNWRGSLDARYRLRGGQCPACEAVSFPATGACQTCHERVDFQPATAEREGTIRALATIGQGGAPPEFTAYQQRDGAYGAAIVELPVEDTDGETVRLPAQLTDAALDEVAVGDAVQATIRRVYEQESIPRYGVKFTPVG